MEHRELGLQQIKQAQENQPGSILLFLPGA